MDVFKAEEMWAQMLAPYALCNSWLRTNSSIHIRESEMVGIRAQLVSPYALWIPFSGTQQHIALEMLLNHPIYRVELFHWRTYRKRSIRSTKPAASKASDVIPLQCFDQEPLCTRIFPQGGMMLVCHSTMRFLNATTKKPLRSENANLPLLWQTAPTKSFFRSGMEERWPECQGCGEVSSWHFWTSK